MTTVSYPLDVPPAAALRAGDCHARDLTQGRNIIGPHRFATTTACQISNGLLRLTVGASGAAPSLTVEAWRGLVNANDDVFLDVFYDVYPGTLTGSAEWFPVGAITVDSPAVSALLTGVRLELVNPQMIIVRLVAAAMGDAFVKLRQDWRQVEIQHGDPRLAVSVSRRVRLTDSPTPTGTAAASGRVEESSPVTDGMPRFVAAVDPVTANAGAFSLTATSTTTARFGAGIATTNFRDTPADHQAQLSDASLLDVVIA